MQHPEKALDKSSVHYSFTGALLTRFFLSFVEAALLIGALFLISKWSVGLLVNSYEH